MSRQLKIATITETQEQLKQLDAFMASGIYAEWVADLRERKEAVTMNVFSFAPQNVGEAFQREQAIGQGQVVVEMLEWLPSYRAALEEQLSNLKLQQEGLQ